MFLISHYNNEPFILSIPMAVWLLQMKKKTNLKAQGKLPAFVVKVRRYVLTYFLTSSSLDRLNSLRILDALFGPLILGFSTSVSPGKSLSPFFTITKFRTERSGLTMHPRTDFLLRSPLRLPYPRKQGVPVYTINAKRINLSGSSSKSIKTNTSSRNSFIYYII